MVTPTTTPVEGASLIQGIPAGLEFDLELQSQLGDFSPEDEASSDHLSDEDSPAL